LNYLSRNLDNLLVAKYFGANILGIYEKTYQVMRYPLQLFTFAITPALQPVLTKYRDQPEKVAAAFYKVALRLAIIGAFSSTVLWWRAADVVYVLFGEQWLATVPLLQILALSIPVQMVLSSTGGVYQAFGAVKTMFWCGLFSSFTTVAAIVYGVYVQSLPVLCTALVAVFHVNFIQCIFALQRSVFAGQSWLALYITCAVLSLSFINIGFGLGAPTFPADLLTAVLNIAQTSVLTAIPAVLLLWLANRRSW